VNGEHFHTDNQQLTLDTAVDNKPGTRNRITDPEYGLKL